MMLERIDYEENNEMLREEEVYKTFLVPVVHYRRVQATDEEAAIDIVYREEEKISKTYDYDILENEVEEY